MYQRSDILLQIRWLDRVSDPKAVSEKMSEMVQSAPETLQGDIIEALPEIVDENHQSGLAPVLRELMQDCPRLTGVVLQAFTYLAIRQEIMADVHRYDDWSSVKVMFVFIFSPFLQIDVLAFGVGDCSLRISPLSTDQS